MKIIDAVKLVLLSNPNQVVSARDVYQKVKVVVPRASLATVRRYMYGGTEIFNHSFPAERLGVGTFKTPEAQPTLDQFFDEA